MKYIVRSNPLGASPEFYRTHPGVIAGCFGSQTFYYVSKWEWSCKPQEAAVLDSAQVQQILTEAKIRYEHLQSYQKIEIGFAVVP